MPANPPPDIQAGLGLITQKLLRSDMQRAAEVTFGVFNTGVAGPALALTMVNSFQTAFNGHIAPLMDGEVSVLPPFIRLGDGTNVPFEALAAGAAVLGGSPGTFAPPATAMLVKKGTGIGGKKNRGRTYYPFILPNSEVSENGTISSSEVTAAQTVMTDFLTALATADVPMVIVNKLFDTSGPKPFVTNVNKGPDVASYSVERIIATQRRRLGR